MPSTTPVGPRSQTLPALVDAVAGLVSPPHICMRVQQLIEDESATAATLGEVIAQDPSLAARLLRLANSSFYGLRRPVDTLSRAVSVVGGREIYGLTLAVWAVEAFDALEGPTLDIDTFWRHSLFCGLLARLLGVRAGYRGTERLFVAGLLHDVGALALAHGAPTLTAELHQQAGGLESGLHPLERERLGFTHAELGAELLARWGLPESITTAIRMHHRPGRAETWAQESALVHVAEALANTSELSSFTERAEPAAAIAAGAREQAGLDPAASDDAALLGEAGLQFTDVAVAMGR